MKTALEKFLRDRGEGGQHEVQRVDLSPSRTEDRNISTGVLSHTLLDAFIVTVVKVVSTKCRV